MEKGFGLLRDQIRMKYKTGEIFAKELGVCPQTLSRMLCGRADWTRSLMIRAAELLGIKEDDIVKYFF